MSSIFNGIKEAKRSPEPDYNDPSWDEKVSNVGQKAKQAQALKAKGKEPRTRWNPETKKYYVDFSDDEKKVEEGVNLSPEQIQQIFKGAENIETSAGANRSIIGKAKDLMTKNQPQSTTPTVRQYSNNPTSRPTTTPTSGLSAIAPKRATAKPGEINGLPMRESVELTESQIYLLIGKIVEHQKQVDEGVMDWARTKGQNLTNKITADKLLQAWKKTGSNTDSDRVADVMIGAGVPKETVTNLMKNFVSGPTSSTTNPDVFQGVDRSIPAVQRKAQASAIPMPSNWRPSDTVSSVPSASTLPPTTSNVPKAGKVGAPAGKQAVDQAIATVKSVRGDRRPKVANYGKQQFDALAQATAKQSAATVAPAATPKEAPAADNTIAMPKPGEKIKIGGQEIKPSDPLYAKLQRQMNQKKTTTAESVGLPYPGTYEETNDMFKSSGQRRIGTLTTEDEQIDGMAQGEIREIIKNAIHIKNQLDKGVSLDGWMYSFVTVSNDKLNSVAEQINNPNIEEQGVAEGSEQINELRDRMYQYIRSIVPTWPEYVVQDWLYKGRGKNKNYNVNSDVKGEILEMIADAGLSPNTNPWQLVPNMKFTMDMFGPVSKKNLIGRAGGTSDLGMGIPKDKERHSTQAALIQKGGVSKEPAILIKRPEGYDLLEGWHRTIQHFHMYPNGYTGPAYVAVAQGQQGVAEGQHSCPHCGGEMVSEELMNEKKDACYYKVKSRYKVWPSAYASGALVKCRKKGADSWGNGGKKNESSILEGINQTDESLHDWFTKEKWVRMDTKGNIKGPCAREPGEGKPKCLPQSKAHSLGKKGRASAAQRKRREDPNPERHGKAINVNTKKETKG